MGQERDEEYVGLGEPVAAVRRGAAGRWDAFRPSRFRRGRLAARVCVGYLAVVVVALVLALVFSGPGTSMAGVWLLFATMPSSLLLLSTLVPVMDALTSGPGEPSTVSTVLLVAGFYLGPVVCGVLQAMALWFLLRGRPREVSLAGAA